jgi:lysozyme
MLQGVDVSYAQGTIDWQKVAGSDVKFAYAKATEGQSLVDDQFEANVRALSRTPIRHGAYHFLRFNIDPVVQARHFLATANPSAGDLVPMVDVEVNNGVPISTCISNLSAFLKVVELQIKRFMMIYTSYGFWNDTMAGSDAFSGHPLWIAEYNNDPVPTLPSAWTKWIIWQHSDAGNIPGIAGNVDLNRLNGDNNVLASLVLS